MFSSIFTWRNVTTLFIFLTFLLFFPKRIIAITTPTLTPSPTTAPSVIAGGCTQGTGWLNLVVSSTQGKQLNGLPVSEANSDRTFAYGRDDSVFYSLGRLGIVVYKFPGDVQDIPGSDISIFEVSNGRESYPLESAHIDVSQDGITWLKLGPLATSRVNVLGITSLDFGITGLSKMRYIRLTDIDNPNNTIANSNGFDLNAVQALNQDCSQLSPIPTPSSAPTPSIAPTITPSKTPTPTRTPTPAPNSQTISIDFGVQTSVGSPYVFGGSHSPKADMTDAWNKLQSVGVTAVRLDLFPEIALPSNMTLADYINNVNNIQDPANWYRVYIDDENKMFTEARNRGMKTIGIMDFAPAWLNTCNCNTGVPKDFAVYKDIVKKTYVDHRNYMDYVEIWNEPTYPIFLNLYGSTMTAEEAYVMIYKTAAAGIREVDAEINDGKRAVIGGLSAHSPGEYTMLRAMASDSAVMQNIDFVSYHNYSQRAEPSWDGYKNIMAAANRPNIPMYMTEWNYVYSDQVPTPYNGGAQSVSYTGHKLIDFLKMGLFIANYHTLQAVNTFKANNCTGSYGFFRWDATTGTATLLEQAKTWRIMSKTLGLGAGNSQIYAGVSSTNIPSLGFTNSAGKKGVVFVNEATASATFTINTSNLIGRTKANAYKASANNDGGTLVGTVTPITVGNIQSWIITVPALSVTGLMF